MRLRLAYLDGTLKFYANFALNKDIFKNHQAGGMEVPPGQVYARKWIIYAELGVPKLDLNTWRLWVKGIVDVETCYSMEDLKQFQLIEVKQDFHCVTGWSIGNLTLEGVRLMDLVSRAVPNPKAEWIMFHSADGYTTPVPVEDALSDSSILVLKMNGRPLSPAQGFPARPFIPQLYGWKSAKWLTQIEFIESYKDGYWEKLGYHERGDVMREERFKSGDYHHSRRHSVGTAIV